ncbi:MAG: carboxypeptidase regulatory-like domain-containing protein [Candidatus Cloacimonetes bacterium]|nr:carboxypeptidase regulatory-like domain-containing protein [Candidatus Cloacimonadota bacterium]
MKRCVFFVLLALSFVLFADTEIPAGSVSGNWNLVGSPYNVNGEIQIDAGTTLTIDAGVTVNFTGHYKFIVLGQILAVGTNGNEIIFTADDDVAGWHGLRFLNTTTTGQDESQLIYCNLEYGRATGISSDYQGGVLYCLNSSELLIQYCTFSDNSATTGGTMYLQNSDIEMNFVEVTGGVASGAGGGIYLNGSDIILSDSEITDNFAVYDGGGVNCFASNPVFTRVLIAGNTTNWNGAGISVFNNSSPTFTKLTMVGNLANQNGSAIACLYGSVINMVNSIVWNNAYNAIYVEQGTTCNITYSDLATGSGQSYYGIGCITADPLFTNPAIGDYSLSWDNMPTHDETMSPCIDAGDPNGAADPDGTIADMGAVYFVQTGIQGTVTLIEGNGEVQDVEITATLLAPPNTEYVTNPDNSGSYMFTLPSGTYEVVAVLEGYSTETFESVEVASQLITLDIELTPPPPGEIVGVVTVEGIGNPTAVLIQAGAYATYPYAVLDPFTQEILYYEYTLSLSPGVYTVTASLAGYETQTEAGIIVVSGQQTEDIDFYLPLITNEGTITGVVDLINGAGDVEDVIISAGDVTTSPAADGTYEIDLLNGVYDVTASLDGFSLLTQKNINVTAFQITPDINFTLIGGWEQIEGTQYSMIVYATVTYDGAFVGNDGSNQLAAFGYDETGTIEQCRGNATWVAGSHFLWDNFYALDGFWYITIVSDDNSGTDLLWFDFYNSETGDIEVCNEMVFFEDGLYDIGLDLTIDSPLTDVTYDLVEGWNWVSFNRLPVNSSVSSVFDVLDDVPDIFHVKNQTSFAQYDIPSTSWVGGLHNISWDTGYKIQMHNDFAGFTFNGEMINPITHPINIEQGWNWISYIPETTLPIAEALQSISIPDSTCLKTQSQSAVYFGAWIGDLQNMEAGKAYLLSWPEVPNEPLFLVYPPETEEVRSAEDIEPVSNLANWQPVTGNLSNMILMAELTANENAITNDSQYSAGVFDNKGKCRSIGKLENDFWYFTITGDAPELLEFRIYDNAAKTTITSTNSIRFEADSIVGNPANLFKIDFQTGEVPVNSQFVLNGNYPNPFNPTTMFSYNIPEGGMVNLSIYNVKGQLVETLVNSHQDAGEHTINWSADNQSSGIYFYRLQSGSNQITRKCILMK